ncbi:MAG: ribonuclease Z [Clostridia bacterium]|nr:ribonuclease Z [Clostridia bacterium]
MKLIFCVDKKNGIMFFGKRQSQDSVLRKWIIAHTADSKLWMSNYSAEQFSDLSGYIADDDYNAKAGKDDYCFVENNNYNLENVNEIIICRWKRQYPADLFFNIDLKANGFRNVRSEDIVGSSHDKITIEIYKRG